MTQKRRREIAKIAAAAYAKIMEMKEIPDANEEFDYFLTTLMMKISVDLYNYLGEDLEERG